MPNKPRNPGMPKRQRKQKPGTLRGWFSAKMPFGQFARIPTLVSMEKRIVEEELRNLALIPQGWSVLEAGPGFSPLARTFDFKSVTYLEGTDDDASRTTAKHILWDTKSAEKEMLFGKLQEIDRLGRRFDLVIANEVFTHIPPKERPATLQKIMKTSRAIFITDRYATVYPPGKTGPIYRGTLVDYRPLEEELKKHGYTVLLKTIEVKWSPDKYFILRAIKVT